MSSYWLTSSIENSRFLWKAPSHAAIYVRKLFQYKYTPLSMVTYSFIRIGLIKLARMDTERWIYVSITSVFTPQTRQYPVHSQTPGTHASTAKSPVKQSCTTKLYSPPENTASWFGALLAIPPSRSPALPKSC